MKRLHVTGIGNALVDILARVDDAFLAENGVQKGIMQLIDTARATELYADMGPAHEVSGGSAANTIAGLGMLGARAAYVGKVRDDQLGRIFAHDIRSLGVEYATSMPPEAPGESETGRCYVLVTPDGERSMNTYLGVSADLSPDDIDETQIAESDWIYLEGYRFDGFDSQEAFRKAIAAAKAAGTKVSITLSDPFCIERWRPEFLRMAREEIDLLFANEHELQSLYETDDLDAACARAREEIPLTACTLGPEGVRILNKERDLTTPAAPATRVDATGAGDLFAAGFLYGLTHGADLETAGRMGCVAAGEVISHIGARPEADLKAMFRDAGLM